MVSFIRTRPSASATAHATAIDDRRPGGGGDRRIQTGHSAAPQADDLHAVVRLTISFAFATIAATVRVVILLELEHAEPAGDNGGAAPARVPASNKPVLDQGNGAIEGGDHAELVSEQAGHDRRRLGDVDDRDVQRLLQALRGRARRSPPG